MDVKKKKGVHFIHNLNRRFENSYKLVLQREDNRLMRRHLCARIPMRACYGVTLIVHKIKFFPLYLEKTRFLKIILNGF